MDGSEIREIDAADLTSCARLHAKVYSSPPWNDGWTEAKSEEYLGQLLGIPGSFGKVFVAGGDICGVVIGRQKVWWNNDEICVEEIFVDLDAQGQGIGSRLLDAVWALVEEKGLAGITLLTNKYMPAMEFYKNRAFQHGEHVALLYKVPPETAST